MRVRSASAVRVVRDARRPGAPRRPVAIHSCVACDASYGMHDTPQRIESNRIESYRNRVSIDSKESRVMQAGGQAGSTRVGVVVIDIVCVLVMAKCSAAAYDELMGGVAVREARRRHVHKT